jgi:DNA-binding PadR family transcriptional regulator
LRSAVNAAVLSLVIARPSYGGEIGRRFEERYDGLLASRPQHVYKALDQLKLQGLIEPIVIEAEDGSTRDGYRATANGARVYRGWLRAPVPLSKDAPLEIMIRIASTRPDDVATAELLLDAYEQAVLATASRRPVRSTSFIDRAVDEERRLVVGARLRWIRWMRDELCVCAGEHER